MRIESIAAKSDRAGRYLVRFEDGSFMRLYRQTVEDHGLYTGLKLTQEQISQLREDAGEASAKMRAVRIVAASNVSRNDLEQRLVQKGESPQQARQAVMWLEELNLVNDSETARQIVSRCIAKGYGLARAKQVLYEKKISKQYWEEALGDYPDQQEHILSFLRSRLKRNAGDKELRRATDALLRRGHSYGEIRKAMEQLALDADDFSED